MFQILRVSLAALIALSAPAFAKPETYICDMKTNRDRSWIPKQVVLQHEAGSSTAIVNDPIINAYVGQPVNGKVTNETSQRLSVSWTLTTVASNGDRTKMAYSITIGTADLHASMRAVPAGYDNSFNGRGQCRRR